MRKLSCPAYLFSSLLLLGVMVFNTGCRTHFFPSVFKIDIGQGNIIEHEQVSRLKLGMTREQVLYVMGSPMIEDPLNIGRWDYVYWFQSGLGDLEQSSVVLHFDGDRLSKIAPEDVVNKAP